MRTLVAAALSERGDCVSPPSAELPTLQICSPCLEGGGRSAGSTVLSAKVCYNRPKRERIVTSRREPWRITTPSDAADAHTPSQGGGGLFLSGSQVPSPICALCPEANRAAITLSGNADARTAPVFRVKAGAMAGGELSTVVGSPDADKFCKGARGSRVAACCRVGSPGVKLG